MNNNKKIMAFLVVFALACMPLFAQRPAGNNNSSRSGASVSRSSAPSSSRSSSVSSSRSSAPSRSVSSAPRSSSSNRSTVSRSSNSAPRSGNVSTPRNNTSRNSVSAGSSRAASRDLSVSRSSSPNPKNNTVGRGGNTGNDNRRGTLRGGNEGRRGNTGIGQGRGNNGVGRNTPPASGRDVVQGVPAHNAKEGNVRHLSTGDFSSPGNRFATPARPNNPMPPSHRPMHPAPYFHHPHHHGRIHMHVHPWHRVHFEPVCWPGFWHYCNSYWYDYHVTNTVAVTNYVRETYNANLVSYIISGNLMYAIIDDVDGNTYLKVFDNNDNLLAVQEISRKYITMELDRENGGCWIFKKKGKDPMLFLYVEGELLIYEAD